MKLQITKDAIAILLLALLVLLPQLGGYPLLEPDEARYVEIPREMLLGGDYVIPRLNNIIYLEKPPFFYWLQTLPIRLFGIQEMAVRFWNAFFAAFSCMMIYLAGRLLYDRKTGWLAAGLLFSSCLFFSMAHFITLDMTLSGLVTGCLSTMLIGLSQTSSSQSRPWFILASIFAALALLTKGLIGLLLPGSIFVLWVLATQQWDALKKAHIPLSLVIFLAIVVPWHVLAQMRVEQFFDFYIIGQHFTRYLTLAEQRYQPAWFFMPILFAGLMPWTFFTLQAIIRQVKNSGLSFKNSPKESFLLIWAGFIFIFFSLSKSKLVPYILPVLPPLMLLLSRDLLTYSRKRWEILATVATLALIALALAVFPLLSEKFIPDYQVSAHSLTFTILGIALIGCVLLSLFIWRKKPATSLIALGLGGLCLFSISIPLVLDISDRSIKPLAEIINTQKEPGDEIVAFRRYFQDLPLYTQEIVTVVDRKGELDFGMTLEDTSGHMISSEDFYRKWENPDHRMFVVMSLEKFEDYFKHDKRAEILGSTSRYVLISTRAVQPHDQDGD